MSRKTILAAVSALAIAGVIVGIIVAVTNLGGNANQGTFAILNKQAEALGIDGAGQSSHSHFMAYYAIGGTVVATAGLAAGIAFLGNKKLPWRRRDNEQLSPLHHPPRDQGKAGICTAFAFAAVLEYMVHRDLNEKITVSPAFLAEMSHRFHERSDMLRMAVLAMNCGWVLEEKYPFVESRFDEGGRVRVRRRLPPPPPRGALPPPPPPPPPPPDNNVPPPPPPGSPDDPWEIEPLPLRFRNQYRLDGKSRAGPSYTEICDSTNWVTDEDECNTRKAMKSLIRAVEREDNPVLIGVSFAGMEREVNSGKTCHETVIYLNKQRIESAKMGRGKHETSAMVEKLGWHSMVLWSYDKNTQIFTIRNSHGTNPEKPQTGDLGQQPDGTYKVEYGTLKRHLRMAIEFTGRVIKLPKRSSNRDNCRYEKNTELPLDG